MVSKDEYLAWEQLVITAFYEDTQRPTQLVPGDGSPAVLRKEKVMLVLLERDGVFAEQVALAAKDKQQKLQHCRTVELQLTAAEKELQQVALSAKDELPAKRSLKIFHCGRQALDGVSYGLDGDVFKHPACDVGGLTNCKQKLGSKVDFVGPTVNVENNDDLETQSVALYEAWEKVSKRALPESFKADLREILSSALAAFNSGGVTVRFFIPPAEHRVLVMSSEVHRKTNKYYVRVFGGEDYARELDQGESTKDVFCAISKGYITPNINMRNIELEYSRYSSTEWCPSRKDREFTEVEVAVSQPCQPWCFCGRD